MFNPWATISSKKLALWASKIASLHSQAHNKPQDSKSKTTLSESYAHEKLTSRRVEWPANGADGAPRKPRRRRRRVRYPAHGAVVA